MAQPERESSDQQMLSQNVIIGLASFTLLLVIIYPWIIAITVISFAIGFTCFEHFDRLIKTLISTGRFGPDIQNYFMQYINEKGTSAHKNFIKEVTADPLREYLELEESKLPVQSQASNKGIQVHHSLILPEGIPSSNRSSPEKNKSARDSPIRSLSAACSRRVSEDILTSTLGGSLHHRRESSNKTPSPSKSSNPSPSPSLALSAEVTPLRVDQEFRVDDRIDKAFGRLCTSILNYYISSSWAPYETRRQLRLSFKQLFASVGEDLSKKLLICKGDSQYPPIVKLARQKLLPLLLHYLDKTLTRGLLASNIDDPIISDDSRKRIVLKLRKFCKQIAEKYLSKEDQKCKLWMELFVAVLADGVLVNVMNLGKDKLPELFEEVVTNFKKASKLNSNQNGSLSPTKSVNFKEAGDRHSFADPLSDNYPEETLVSQQKDESASVKSDISLSGDSNIIETAKISCLSSETVPFLLDSFLDPPYNLEKPDQIVSRWRPTLKDIVSETDLLYPLIQYMKYAGGQQSLAYLQGVLDDFPQEGDPHCRRVLELEYLPGFCRSSLLLETMGLNRVEMALEVGTDILGMRRNSGHARSASYGGPSSSSFREFLKIEQGIVDGLPLTENNSHLNSLSSTSSDQSSTGNNTTGATLPGAGTIEPSLAFKRRPHLEMYIAKFIKSTTKSWKQYYDPLAEKCEPAKREGIEAKSYEDWNHPEVNSRVRVYATNEDIYDSVTELVMNLIRDSPIASPFLSGIAQFLKPYLMPVFDSQIDKSLSQLLSVDLLVLVVDLISEVFEESPNQDIDLEEGRNKNDDKIDLSDEIHSNPEDDTSHHHNSSCTTCDPGFKSTFKSFLMHLLECFTVKLVDLDYFVKCSRKSREYIFLFFVDLLDVLVNEIIEK